MFIMYVTRCNELLSVNRDGFLLIKIYVPRLFGFDSRGCFNFISVIVWYESKTTNFLQSDYKPCDVKAAPAKTMSTTCNANELALFKVSPLNPDELLLSCKYSFDA